MPACNGDECSVVVAADFCDLLAFLPLFVSKHLAQEISCIGTGGDSIVLFFVVIVGCILFCIPLCSKSRAHFIIKPALL